MNYIFHSWRLNESFYQMLNVLPDYVTFLRVYVIMLWIDLTQLVDFFHHLLQ